MHPSTSINQLIYVTPKLPYCLSLIFAELPMWVARCEVDSATKPKHRAYRYVPDISRIRSLTSTISRSMHVSRCQSSVVGLSETTRPEVKVFNERNGVTAMFWEVRRYNCTHISHFALSKYRRVR